jgi:hypothetical protein
MARSTYVYVVTKAGEEQATYPEAAFTVKRELRAWLARQADPGMYRAFRLADNPGHPSRPVTEMSVQEILNG